MPKAKIIYSEGNHEFRLRKYLLSEAKALAGLRALTLEKLLDFERLRIRWQPQDRPYRVGSLLFTHDQCCSKWSGQTARQHYEKYGCCVIHGHTHRLGAFYHQNVENVFGCWENGCLCSLNPDYVTTPDWQHGFSVVWNQDAQRSYSLPPVAFSPPESTSALAERCRAYVAAMPPAVQGQNGHSALLKVANVIFHGFGLSESEGWPIMLEYNARCLPPWDLSDPKQDRDFRRKMNQAREKPTTEYPFGKLAASPQYASHSISRLPLVDSSTGNLIERSDADISFLIENLSKQSPPIVAVDEDDQIPEHLVYVPGFTEKIVQFCLEAAPHPNRMLAFCGALALMSFLITRKVQTRSGIRPNLYIIALAGSGTGKDFIRKVNNYILEMTGQEEMTGETIASGDDLPSRHFRTLFRLSDFP